jgi:hypothetical protein
MRRQAIFVALLLALVVCVPAPADDWPQFRGSVNLAGVAQSVPPEDLRVLWTYEAGDAIDSSAAIVNGVVYVGCYSGELLAIDLATGKLRWSYDAGEPIGESSPAVADGIVYVGDLMGVLHAV